MGKAKQTKQTSSPAAAPARNAGATADTGRRNFLGLGIAAAAGVTALAAGAKWAGWFDAAPAAPANTVTAPPVNFRLLPPVTREANAANGLLAGEEIVTHYTHELLTPSAVIHAVRAFGRDFKLADGTNAVTHLCEKYGREREVNGKRYVYFEREAEFHENSFLKTFLEAGVPATQPVRAGTTSYTMRDVAAHAPQLFRFDPLNFARYEKNYYENHLPWGLIAFSLLRKPAQGVWTNAFGEQINLHAILDATLSAFETMCHGVEDTILAGQEETIQFRQALQPHSCYGMHAVYGFLSCYQHGYRQKDMPTRMRELFDTTIARMEGDGQALDREAAAARRQGPEVLQRMAVSQEGRIVSNGAPPPTMVEVMRLRSQIKMLGHALESINFIRLHKTFPLTPQQQQRVAAGEAALADSLVKLRAQDLDAFRRWHPKFVSDIVIAVSHAVRALKLLTPKTPDQPSDLSVLA